MYVYKNNCYIPAKQQTFLVKIVIPDQAGK